MAGTMPFDGDVGDVTSNVDAQDIPDTTPADLSSDGSAADRAGPPRDGKVIPSPGCGKPATDPPGQFVCNKPITVDGQMRKYGIRLPQNYDPKKPYRIIFSFHACVSHCSTLINIQNAPGFDAIIIAPEQIGRTPPPGSGAPSDCFDDQSRVPHDLPVFDALLQWAESNLCVDEARVFAIGFSSGSWMTNQVACERASVIRAKANVSGGLTNQIMPSMDCKGPVAGIFLHDQSDMTNPIKDGIYARDTLLQLNGCAMTSKPYTMVPANANGLCVTYDGCLPGEPVVWCQTTGKGHDAQQGLSPALFWEFLSQF